MIREGDRMAKVLVVTSGKGGVGKTTTTAALGAALAQGGQKVVVVDFDVGLRNRPIQAWLDGDVLKVAAAE